MPVRTMPYLYLNLNPVRTGIFIANYKCGNSEGLQKGEGYPNSTASNLLPWISHLTPLWAAVPSLAFRK